MKYVRFIYLFNYIFTFLTYTQFISLQMNPSSPPGTLEVQDIPPQQLEIQNSSQAIRQYNFKLIKKYLKNSCITLLAFFIMLIMFIFSVVMTYDQNSRSISKYSFTSLNPVVLIKLGANYGFLVKYGDVFRLITAIFLHAGIQHFLMNTASIFGLLLLIEGEFKKIGGIQGNLLSVYANFLRQRANVLAVGASTSICSILGLYLATLYIISLKNGTVETAKKKIYFAISYLFLISILPGIDFFGHFGSLITGVLVGLSFTGVKIDYGEDSLNIKKLKIYCLIGYSFYSIALLTFFWI